MSAKSAAEGFDAEGRRAASPSLRAEAAPDRVVDHAPKWDPALVCEAPELLREVVVEGEGGPHERHHSINTD